jgi:hypothetical protein
MACLKEYGWPLKEFPVVIPGVDMVMIPYHKILVTEQRIKKPQED